MVNKQYPFDLFHNQKEEKEHFTFFFFLNLVQLWIQALLGLVTINHENHKIDLPKGSSHFFFWPYS